MIWNLELPPIACAFPHPDSCFLVAFQQQPKVAGDGFNIELGAAFLRRIDSQGGLDKTLRSSNGPMELMAIQPPKAQRPNYHRPFVRPDRRGLRWMTASRRGSGAGTAVFGTWSWIA
ncbi:hypothetical protein CFAM422_004318 [Trichoderma lentiforme]|uniref:Uncharacterized protein n=1 Tax=Trichoderma lentiforme TaxID=1567552 RepID=A0A9P4XIJ6_9HYPO|nr:hypothetical protein CFAM422_004318 [Trichoderma lentiforme]